MRPGGAQIVWVRGGNTNTAQLLNLLPLRVNAAPPAPRGFEGVRTFVWSPDTNGTVTLGIVNAYGASVPIGYYESIVHVLKGPNFYMTGLLVFLLLAAGFTLLRG